MAKEMLSFERLTRALTNLSQDDLLSLLKAVDALMPTKFSDPALSGQIFNAQGTFYKELSEVHMTLDEMLELIQGFNPAEVEVISHLVPYYFDRARHSTGQQVSASWGTTSSRVRYASNVWASAPDGVSLDDMQQRAELFKSFITLLKPAQDAKAAGDNQKAAELFEQAMSLLNEQGFTGPELERLRNLLQS